MRLALKSYLEGAGPWLGQPLGRVLSHVPSSVVLGPSYRVAQRQIRVFRHLRGDDQREYVFKRVHKAACHAFEAIPFYRDFYDDAGWHPSDLRSFADISEIPIVTRDDLQSVPLARRSSPRAHSILSNTGGTSGQPLDFYVRPRQYGWEWAHMHHAWAKLGYRTESLRLVFRGRNLGRQTISYSPIGHQIFVNTYAPSSEIIDAVRLLSERRNIEFLHGYPSAIYEFIVSCSEKSPDVLASLRRSLKGVLLGSEYPAAPMRSEIEGKLRVPTLSWWGHSEMAAFAYEATTAFQYDVLQSYGYAETVQRSGGESRLIATAYLNDASPMIRYDTGDLVSPIVQDGLLRSFRVSHGRSGEYILDRNCQRISLTGLIFGRHHEAFRHARFVQISQQNAGFATISLVPRRHGAPGEGDWLSLFDFADVAITFSVQSREEPYRTTAGKVPLLIRSEL